MVSRISSAAAPVDAAYSRYDRAAGAVVAATSLDSSANTGDIADAIVQMDSSQVAVTVSLLLMRKVNDMLATAIDVGGYGLSDVAAP